MKQIILPLLFLSFFYQSVTQEYLELIEPKDGSVVSARKRLTIKWEGHEAEQGFTLEFSSDGGNNWEIIDSNIVGSEYKWLTPNEGLDNCKIRVSQKEFDYVEQDWEKSFGGDGIETISEILKTTDGGYLLSVNTDSKVIMGNKSIGGGDVVLIKLDKDFELEWSKLYGGTKQDYIYEIVELKDSEYTMVINSYSDDNIFETEVGTLSPWIVTVDNKGELIKINNYSSTLLSSYYGLLANMDGVNFLIGTTRNGSNIERLNNFRSGSGFGIHKLDNDKTIEWTKVYGDGLTNNNDNLHLFDVIPNQHGGFTMSGYISFGGNEAYTIATNDDGLVVWDARIKARNYTYPYKLLEKYGATYVCGITYEGNVLIKENHFGLSGFIAKYDDLGNLAWASPYSPTYYDAYYDMSIDKEDNIIACGYSIMEHPDTNITNTQSYITKHASNGKLQWVKNIDSPDSYLSVTKHIEVEDGLVLLANSRVHDQVFTDEYDSDIKLIKMKNAKYKRESDENEIPFSIQTPSSVKSDEYWSNYIDVKVNLSDEVIGISTSNLINELQSVSVYDNSGRQLFALSDKSKLTNSYFKIDIVNFKTGVYYIDFKGNEINYTKKISIVR